MTPEQATFLLNAVYLPQIQNEQKTTRRVIEAIPADNTGWQPDPKSRTALELAWHIASSDCFFLNGMADGKFDPSGNQRPEWVLTPAEVLAWYDENFAKASGKLADMSPEDLARPVNFYGMFNLPAIAYSSFMVTHTVHHRGQLSSYLRPMGGKVPSIYGGSADEEFKMPATA